MPEFPSTPAPRATNVATDRATGTTEELDFRGPHGEKQFGCLYRPRRPNGAGVLICSPVLAELDRNYRREVLLARALATRGAHVYRFHYRGTGNSDDGAMTFGALLEEAARAEHLLGAVPEVERIAFVGTRVGSLIAAHLSRSKAAAPMALWAPIETGQSFFREVFRAQRLAALTAHPTTVAHGGSVLDELRGKGALDVRGYLIDHGFYESLHQLDLVTVAGPHPRPVLLVPMGRRAAPALSAIEKAWTDRNWPVTVRPFLFDQRWWEMGHEVLAGDELVVELAGSTAEWLLDHLSTRND